MQKSGREYPQITQITQIERTRRNQKSETRNEKSEVPGKGIGGSGERTKAEARS
jgi:hypothetical protein